VTDDLARKLLDIEEIKHLKARYFRLLDAKEWDEWTDVFTDDLEFFYTDPTVMNVPPTAQTTSDGALVNRDQLVEFVSESMKRVTTIHHGHVPEITLVDDDTATGRWGLTNYCEYTTADGTTAWLRGYGHYHEVYARTADGWRIKRSLFYRRDMVP
jgi:3-phenylpropionate/cinnamic acid dioxygenase small subunit